ncbi:hypothetical protein K0M31_006103 [Melipona bicolor]|uniref:Uncharacterized protein n=1 Tax=Melipona bicolor TaxID=60889 RepID=A0AA40FTK0_9HYME|nr:hypothetical protein K0M31_006103 [Melipona bicolor]
MNCASKLRIGHFTTLLLLAVLALNEQFSVKGAKEALRRRIWENAAKRTKKKEGGKETNEGYERREAEFVRFVAAGQTTPKPVRYSRLNLAEIHSLACSYRPLTFNYSPLIFQSSSSALVTGPSHRTDRLQETDSNKKETREIS